MSDTVSQSIGELESDIEELDEQLEDEDGARIELARTLADAVAVHGENGEIEPMATKRSRIEELLDEEPTTELRAQLARALANEGRYNARYRDDAGDVEKVRENLDAIETLYDSSPEAVSQWLARSLRDVTVTEMIQDNDEGAFEAGERLEQLYEDHSTDAVAGHLAWVNGQAIRFELAEDSEHIEEAIADIEELYENHTTADVAEGLARGLGSVIEQELESLDESAGGDTQQVDEQIAEMQEQVAALYDEHSVEVVAEEFARCLFQTQYWYLQTEELSTAAERTEQLADLYEEYSDNDIVAEQFSRALGESVFVRSDAGQFDLVETRLDQMDELYQRRSDLTWVGKNFASALRSAGESYIDEMQIDKAREKLERDVVQEYGDEELQEALEMLSFVGELTDMTEEMEGNQDDAASMVDELSDDAGGVGGNFNEDAGGVGGNFNEEAGGVGGDFSADVGGGGDVEELLGGQPGPAGQSEESLLEMLTDERKRQMLLFQALSYMDEVSSTVDEMQEKVSDVSEASIEKSETLSTDVEIDSQNASFIGALLAGVVLGYLVAGLRSWWRNR